METLFSFQAPAGACGYLSDQVWRLEYERVLSLSPEEYLERMKQGWRRFGHTLFHPQCPTCRACQSLRVSTATFGPNRSQRRAFKANQGTIEVRIGAPSVSRKKLQLYDRFHAFQSQAKGWPDHPAKDAADYFDSFVNNPFPVEEWCYFLNDRLVGVGYVDVVPDGMSAIYFYYEPEERHRSLGTFNVLSVLAEAYERGLSQVYLGYYVAGCPSLEYKSFFRPNQVMAAEGRWVDFIS